MSDLFEELDYRATQMGELSLRRRRDITSGTDVFEIKLGDEFLMSSAFIASETALADLALADLAGDELDVVVGGLGLGYTAKAVLACPRVRALDVIEALDAVIDWHREGLVPLRPALCDDARCRLVAGDFFALSASRAGFDASRPERRYDAILLDIDHAPDKLLDPSHGAFYTPEGLARLSAHLTPGGVFALWSNDPPEDDFISRLAGVFAQARGEPVTFRNPLQDRDFTQTVYLASTRA